MDVRVTDRATYKRCRRLFDYVHRQHLKPYARRRGARWIGSAAHAAAEELYRRVGHAQQSGAASLTEDEMLRAALDGLQAYVDLTVPETARQAMSEQEQLDLEQDVAFVTGMLEGYVRYARANDDFEVVAVEEELAADIPGTPHRLVGRLDLLVRRRGRLWVVDHKTTRTFEDPEYMWYNDQMTAYLYLVWRRYGEFPAGAMYEQWLKALPQEPSVNKDGRVSVAAITTTYEVYLAALLRNGQDPDDPRYRDKLDALRGVSFFRRELVARTQEELLDFERSVVWEAREMADPGTPSYPNYGRDCLWCDYKVLCKTQAEGGHVQSVIDQNYYVLEGRLP